ncbi:MAG: glycosyltransferase family 4 protein [Byssovorax sp.]
MRVAVVTTSFPRSAEDPSGHFVLSSSRALAEAGHEVHVIAPGGSLLDRPRERDGLVVHRAGGGDLFAWPGAIARAKESPLRLALAAPFGAGVLVRLREIGLIDRAVAHWIVPSAFPLLLGVTASIEVVAHGADVRFLLASPRLVRERIVKALVDRGAHFTFAAAELLGALRHALSPALSAALSRLAHVEPPPIDLPDVREHAAALRAGLGLAAGEMLAVSVGRLVPTKRVDLAIDAVRALGGGARLVVIGDGPEQAALAKRADGLGASVQLLGALPRREALAWLAAADVLVHPSEVEAAPTVIREARALGVPVVACDAGDVVAWARDDQGIAVVAGAAPAIAAALAALRHRRDQA